MATPTPQPAVRAADFANTVGVNTHMGWLDTTYANAALVQRQLAQIGVRHIRDGITHAGAIPPLQALAGAGVRACLMLPNGALSLSAALADIKRLGGMANRIEGPNEVDIQGSATATSYGGRTGIAGAELLQRDLYAAVRGDPALSGVQVAQWTIGNWGNYPKVADGSANADLGNVHYYPNYGYAPSYGLDNRSDAINYAVNLQKPQGGADAVIMTETGYPTGGGGVLGVNELAQARYIPRLVLENFRHGLRATYIYQLMDPWTRQSAANIEHWWGLFRPDGSAKPAADALRVLMAAVNDAGANAGSFATAPLSCALTGMPETGDSLLLQKSDGTYLLALWNDVAVYSNSTRTDLRPADVPLMLDFAAAPVSVVLRDTLTGKATTLAPSARMGVAVPAHAVVLEIKSGDGSVDPPPPPPPPDPTDWQMEAERLLAENAALKTQIADLAAAVAAGDATIAKLRANATAAIGALNS